MKRHIMTRAAAAVGAAGIGLAALLGAAVAVPAGASSAEGQDNAQAVSESAVNLPGPNLILNPSFEDDDMSMWNLSNGFQRQSLHQELVNPLVGNHGARFDLNIFSSDIMSGSLSQTIEITETGYHALEYLLFWTGAGWPASILWDSYLLGSSIFRINGEVEYEHWYNFVVSNAFGLNSTGYRYSLSNICLEAGDRVEIAVGLSLDSEMNTSGGFLDDFSLTRTHAAADCGRGGGQPGDPDPIDPGVLPLCPAGTTNLVGNPIFADVITGDGMGDWDGGAPGNGVFRSAANPLVGTHSIEWLREPFPSPNWGYGRLIQFIEIPESGYHTFEFWTYVEQGSIQLQPILWSANGIHVVEHMTLDVDDSP